MAPIAQDFVMSWRTHQKVVGEARLLCLFSLNIKYLFEACDKIGVIVVHSTLYKDLKKERKEGKTLLFKNKVSQLFVASAFSGA